MTTTDVRKQPERRAIGSPPDLAGEGVQVMDGAVAPADVSVILSREPTQMICYCDESVWEQQFQIELSRHDVPKRLSRGKFRIMKLISKSPPKHRNGRDRACQNE